MEPISDEYMRQMTSKTKPYAIVILRAGPNSSRPGNEGTIWEHGRRNFALRAKGVLPIVCPIRDGSDVRGIGIMSVSIDKAREVMDDDPGVKAGVFVYEVHEGRSFPGDCLP